MRHGTLTREAGAAVSAQLPGSGAEGLSRGATRSQEHRRGLPGQRRWAVWRSSAPTVIGGGSGAKGQPQRRSSRRLWRTDLSAAVSSLNRRSPHAGRTHSDTGCPRSQRLTRGSSYRHIAARRPGTCRRRRRKSGQTGSTSRCSTPAQTHSTPCHTGSPHRSIGRSRGRGKPGPYQGSTCHPSGRSSSTCPPDSRVHRHW
jgi:hypothetical protein